MTKWIAKWRTERREKRRQALLSLIGRDIENIAHDAYREGVYVTMKQMQAEKLIELQHLMAENEKMREMVLESASRIMPPIVLPKGI